MQYPATSKYEANSAVSPLEPGDYVVRLKEVAESDSNGQKFTDKNGAFYLRFTFEVKGHEGNLLFDRFCFDEEAKNANIQLGRFKQMQIAMGVDTDKPGDTKELIGLKCVAYVKTREYQGKTYNDIKAYKPLDAEGPQVTSDEDDDLPF